MATCDLCFDTRHWKCRDPECGCTVCGTSRAVRPHVKRATPAERATVLVRRKAAPRRLGCKPNRQAEYAEMKRRRKESRDARQEREDLAICEAVLGLVQLVKERST